MHGIFNIIYKDVTRRFCMYDAYSRMEILLGQKGVNRLSTAKIAVFGLGGAGSYTVEALARCGVGSLTLVDHEAITVIDINRQLYALQPTIGHKKVQIAKERVHNIDEDILVHTYETYYNEDTMGLFDLKAYDYIVDAMDTVSSKILLIEQAQKYQVPVGDHGHFTRCGRSGSKENACGTSQEGSTQAEGTVLQRTFTQRF